MDGRKFKLSLYNWDKQVAILPLPGPGPVTITIGRFVSIYSFFPKPSSLNI